MLLVAGNTNSTNKWLVSLLSFGMMMMMMTMTPTTTMTKNAKMTCTEAVAVPAHVEKLLSTVLGSSANLSRLTSGL